MFIEDMLVVSAYLHVLDLTPYKSCRPQQLKNTLYPQLLYFPFLE